MKSRRIKAEVLVRGTHPTGSGASTGHELPDLLRLSKGGLVGDCPGHIIHGHPIPAVGCILCTMVEGAKVFVFRRNQVGFGPRFSKQKAAGLSSGFFVHSAGPSISNV